MSSDEKMNKNRKGKIYYRIIWVVFLSIMLSSCIEDTSTSDWKFYDYGGFRLLRCLRQNGYEVDAINHTDRSSNGRILRIFDTEDRVFLLSCDGTVAVKGLSGKDTRWLDDGNQIIAWIDRPGEKMIFRNGYTEDLLWYYRFDPSGKYLSKEKRYKSVGDRLVRTENEIRIFSVDDPAKPIITIGDVDYWNLCLFAKEDVIYIFASTNDDKNTIFIIHKDDQRYILQETITVPNPTHSKRFAVRDFCPWADEAMFVEPEDWPFRSKLYSFNLRTREMKRVGKERGWGLYLRCDILDQCTEGTIVGMDLID